MMPHTPKKKKKKKDMRNSDDSVKFKKSFSYLQQRSSLVKKRATMGAGKATVQSPNEHSDQMIIKHCMGHELQHVVPMLLHVITFFFPHNQASEGA